MADTVNDKIYFNSLLQGWEETYKKGQMTFWILLALKDGRKHPEEILAFIENITNGTISCDLQSMYRSLRKLYEVEILDFELTPGHKAPDKKQYFISALGTNLLESFSQRNIRLFYQKEVQQLINNS